MRKSQELKREGSSNHTVERKHVSEVCSCSVTQHSVVSAEHSVMFEGSRLTTVLFEIYVQMITKAILLQISCLFIYLIFLLYALSSFLLFFAAAIMYILHWYAANKNRFHVFKTHSVSTHVTSAAKTYMFRS